MPQSDRKQTLSVLFQAREPWMATVRRNGQIEYGRVWAASAEEAGHRAAIAGEVLGVERMA